MSTSTSTLDNARTNLETVKARYSGPDFEARIAAASTVAEVDQIEAEARDALSVAQRKFDSISTSTEARAASVHLIPTDARVTREVLTYDKRNPVGPSFFGDLYAAQRSNSQEALARLVRGTTETRVELEKRGLVVRDAEGRAMSSTATDGGDFLPPLYFGDLFAEVKRARRVTASLFRNLPLAAQGNTITVPKMVTGTSTAVQTSDNQNLSNTDAVTSTITIPVCTVAGYVDLSRQVLERSEPGLDQILAQDLMNSYNSQVNYYCVNGSGSDGQPKGLLNVSSINAITYTDSSPSVPALYPKLLDAIRRVNENVFEPATAFVMTARRWAWILAAVDDDHRPLVVPSAQGNWNSIGVLSSGSSGPFGNDSDSIKPAGTLLGLPVYIDETLPKTLGATTSQDPIITANFNENLIWEDEAGPRNFIFEGILSQTAGIRVQIFGYVASTAERFPGANSVILGTGNVSPSF